jgi:hypothetical protein
MESNEAISQEIAQKVMVTIQAREMELEAKLEESRRRQKDLRQQLHGR